MTAHSGKTVLQGWVRSMTAFGDEQKSMCLRALIEGRFVFWIYACPKLVLVVTRSCPLEGTWPTKRKGWGAPKWQSLWKGNSVRDDFLTVWCLNRQAQLNIICMNYYGLGWHFGRWGQFGMKEWFSMGQNHPHVGVLLAFSGLSLGSSCLPGTAVSSIVKIILPPTKPSGACWRIIQVKNLCLNIQA